MTARWHDLIVDRLKDGGIHLEQNSGLQEPAVINLHPQQLRHVAEQFGLVAPNYPGDELSKRLAEQLCRVYLDMIDEYPHLPRALEDACSRLDGFISGLPDSIYPYHLWDERDEQRKAEDEMRNQIANRQKQAQKAVATTDNQDQQATEKTASAGQQMGLPMVSTLSNLPNDFGMKN